MHSIQFPTALFHHTISKIFVEITLNEIVITCIKSPYSPPFAENVKKHIKGILSSFGRCSSKS